MKPTASLLLAAALGCGACTKSPDSIAPRYVSPVAYRPWTCEQLSDERMRLQGEVTRVSGLQRENANGDAAMLVGGLFLWPVLIGMAATTDRKDELARLKGEYDAVESSQREKTCTVPPPPTMATPAPLPTT